MAATFKSHNRNWPQTKVIISDKDFTEHMVFKKEFPDASLIICFFHTLRTLQQELTCDKLDLLPGERDNALELLTKLAYSPSPQEYENHYNDLKESGLKSVIDRAYLPPMGGMLQRCKFHCQQQRNNNNNDNHLESINAKVKSICSKYSSLSTNFLPYCHAYKMREITRL